MNNIHPIFSLYITIMRNVDLPFKLRRPILACGADLKGAFALAKDREAFLFDGFGDLSDLDNLTRYEAAIKERIRELRIKPEIIAHDLHPGYFSTRFAENYTMYDIRCTIYDIQHHEAHIASAIVDNSLEGDVIGVAFDGTGFGSDGNIWGGEFFIGSLKGFKRACRLRYLSMPGGDMVIKEPYRMSVSYLRSAGCEFPDKKKAAILFRMIDRKINSPLTSSAGRLFDAAASIILGKTNASIEAELPIELEKIAQKGCGETYAFNIKHEDDMPVIDTIPIIKAIVKDLSKKTPKPEISARFHNTIAAVISKVAYDLRKRSGVKTVVLSGGVFQNKYLVKKAMAMLEDANFKVYAHSSIPTNDSGIPIGQIAIAGARGICA